MKDGVYFLKEFSVTMWSGSNFNEHPIHESYCYRSLVEGNPKIYEEYIKTFRETRGRRGAGSFENFIKTYEDIRDNGWNYELKDMVLDKRVKLRNRIRDGQHRASILLFLDKNVKVEKSGKTIKPLGK